MVLTRESSEGPEQSDTYTTIQGWQEHFECWAPENAELPLIAEIYIHSIRLFKELLKLIASVSYRAAIDRQLKRALQTLILWGSQHNVTSGELDNLLGHSSILQRSILRTLNGIGKILTERLSPRAEVSSKKLVDLRKGLYISREKALFILNGPPISKGIDSDNEDDDSDNDDTSEASSQCHSDSFSEIAEDITTETTNLMDLDPVYESALESQPLQKCEKTADIVGSAQTPEMRLYAEQIQMRFPHVSLELASYLGEVNYKRFLRCSHNRMAGEAIVVNEDEFHDSGIGTSVHLATYARSRYAETVMSFHHGNGLCTKVPPIPKDGKNGKPFPCVACGKRVTINNNKTWKLHLFSDLRPYICLEPSCRDVLEPFRSRVDWVRHLAHEHGYDSDWPSFRCSLCSEDTGEGEANVTIHLEKHLQDISLAILPNVLEEEAIIVDDPNDTHAMKLARNVLNARKSRQQKEARFEELEKQIQDLEEEADYWRHMAAAESESPMPPTLESKERVESCERCRGNNYKCDKRYGCINCENLGVECVPRFPRINTVGNNNSTYEVDGTLNGYIPDWKSTGAKTSSDNEAMTNREQIEGLNHLEPLSEKSDQLNKFSLTDDRDLHAGMGYTAPTYEQLGNYPPSSGSAQASSTGKGGAPFVRRSHFKSYIRSDYNQTYPSLPAKAVAVLDRNMNNWIANPPYMADNNIHSTDDNWTVVATAQDSYSETINGIGEWQTDLVADTDPEEVLKRGLYSANSSTTL